jgi:hypothetical protein
MLLLADAVLSLDPTAFLVRVKFNCNLSGTVEDACIALFACISGVFLLLELGSEGARNGLPLLLLKLLDLLLAVLLSRDIGLP